MQLNLKTKTVRFEMVDDESETTITLSSEDDQETICRKLQKVLDLSVSEENVLAALDKPNKAKQAAREPKAQLSSAPPANGWKRYEAPQVPDRLQGEVERIEEGE